MTEERSDNQDTRGEFTGNRRDSEMEMPKQVCMADLRGSQEAQASAAEGEGRERRKELGRKKGPGHMRPCSTLKGFRSHGGYVFQSRCGTKESRWEMTVKTWELLAAGGALDTQSNN